MSLLSIGPGARTAWTALFAVAAMSRLAGCSAPAAGCVRNSDCTAGSYCSAGACVTDCTPATVAADCDPGELCSSFGMCVGGSVDAGSVDAGPGPVDAPPPGDAGSDAPDLRPACVVAGGVDGDGDGYCAGASLDPDCNDADATVSPSAAEVCTPSTATFGARAVDENCDGAIDEACGWYFGTPHPVLVWDTNAANWGFESPRLSADGLRLYIRGGEATGNAIIVMTRPALGMPFAPPVVVGGLGGGTGISSLGISRDELEVYLQVPTATTGMDIFRATRATTSASFGTLVRVAEVSDVAHDYHPYLRSDGLELLFASARTGPSPLYRATRSSASAATWSAPAPITFSGGPASGGGNSPALSADGRTLFFADSVGAGYSLFMATRASRDVATFGTPVALADLNVAGEFTAFAEVSERTAEIFFVSDRAWSAGPVHGLWRARICRDGPCPTASIACAGGTRSPDGHHCYVAQTTPAFQAAASAACVAAGAHLASIHSDAENTFVFDLLGVNAWLGGQQRAGGTDFDYEWVTGEPWLYSAWAAAPVVQPATLPGEDWAAYWTGASTRARWGDWPQVADGGGLPYLCETEEWPTW